MFEHNKDAAPETDVDPSDPKKVEKLTKHGQDDLDPDERIE